MNVTVIIYGLALSVAICIFCYSVFRLVFGLATGKFKRKKDISNCPDNKYSVDDYTHNDNKSDINKAINDARKAMRL